VHINYVLFEGVEPIVRVNGAGAWLGGCNVGALGGDGTPHG
jgi:hypothetical protein